MKLRIPAELDWKFVQTKFSNESIGYSITYSNMSNSSHIQTHLRNRARLNEGKPRFFKARIKASRLFSDVRNRPELNTTFKSFLFAQQASWDTFGGLNSRGVFECHPVSSGDIWAVFNRGFNTESLTHRISVKTPLHAWRASSFTSSFVMNCSTVRFTTFFYSVISIGIARIISLRK